MRKTLKRLLPYLKQSRGALTLSPDPSPRAIPASSTSSITAAAISLLIFPPKDPSLRTG